MSFRTKCFIMLKKISYLQYCAELPPDLACFAGLGSHPNKLYRIISFDKLHVLDLGIIRQYCDLKNSIIQRNSNLPLSRVMSILNACYIDFLSFAHLPSHRPFRSSKQDIRACLSGQIRRQMAPFLWFIIMSVYEIILFYMPS